MEKVAEERAGLERTKLDMMAATERVRTEMMKEVEKIAEEKTTLEKAKADLEATIAAEMVAAQKAKVEMEKVVKERTSYEKANAEMMTEVGKTKEATKALEIENTAAKEALKKSFFTSAKRENETIGPRIIEEPIQDRDWLQSPRNTQGGAKKVPKKKKVLKENVSKNSKRVKGVSVVGDINEFASLTPSALKRKTVKELSSYLTKRGVTVTDENGKTLKKALLLEAVNNLQHGVF